ncbi:mitotic interactor and substrate of PLK1 [Pempheris klunzingeri]|uniref:mitotic interactor and substrate of PLK1 n=1 Tax=Pempheris klunzingeri TaxID=3127111 RepID=UPI00397F427B
MENDSCDDSQSDSGVSADFSPCSTFEGNTSISTPAAVPKETPIEREIRRSIEREQSLRRSRGLPNSPTSPEFVEIPLRKIVLSQSLTESEKCQGKERQFAGKKMQHEIHEEAQREQDLVKLGKVPGFYDKGTVRQLKERKQLFEAFQKPSDSALIVSTRSKATSWSSASDISTLENQEDISSQASTIGDSYVERNSPQSPKSAKGRGSTSLTPRGSDFYAGAGCRVIILENNPSVPAQELYHAKPEAELVTAVDSGRPNISSSRTAGRGGIKGREQEKEEEEEEVAPKENPFFKLRSSTNVIKVKQDIREAQEREKELHKQRISLYGNTEGAKGGEAGGGGGGRRGKPAGPTSPTLSSSSLNGLVGSGSSSMGVTAAPAVRQSVGKLGMWPPAQAEEEQINRTEVLHSPRSPRQKSPLVQRWESGLVNGHNEEDD